jgi:peroxiredoxin
MRTVKRYLTLTVVLTAGLFFFNTLAFGQSQVQKDSIYDPGPLKPIDSKLKVKAGDPAPDFTLPSVSGKKISLSQFKGEKNVVLSFVPAAWTPVCSEQWPGYNLVKDVFDEGESVLLGISVDNIPTLYAWTRQMGSLWFEVLSDFWPHGAITDKYGVLRSDGFAERAVFVIDKEGIIRAAMVTDINIKPDFTPCASALKKLNEEYKEQ